MLTKLKTIFSHPIFAAGGFIFLLAFFESLPLPWNAPVEAALTDLHLKIRGPRHLADDFVLVFIGAEDDSALGGWPITRDYYGYLMHVLTQRGAKVIGFDLLFDTASRSYPEYDDILAGFFESAGNVCLPLAFRGELAYESGEKPAPQVPGKLGVGLNPVFPIASFRKYAAGIGFSNFSSEAEARRLALVAQSGDSLVFSFGFELARAFLQIQRNQVVLTADAVTLTDAAGQRRSVAIDSHGRMWLNHFGGVGEVTAIGLVDLLEKFERAPDSLDFTGKLVLVAVTAPGRTTLKATPLSPALPASLLHLTVAENIIRGTFLREIPLSIRWLLIALLFFAGWLVWQTRPMIYAVGGFLLLVGFNLASALLFAVANLAVPLFYPTLAFGVSVLWHGLWRVSLRKEQDHARKILLEAEIAAKEAKLVEAAAKLDVLQEQLQREFMEKQALSEQTQQLAETSRNSVLALEKQLSDLRVYATPVKGRISASFSEVIHAPGSKMEQVLALVAKVSDDIIPVLISGETGTGKELIARAIHHNSRRKSMPFVAVNCAALPETLLESELFGHEKGSFTGATARRRGRFELADGGTLFLDEISETSPAFQSRLLRVLQEGTIERVGGERTIAVDVRIITACNRGLQEIVDSGRFRADLFYRLSGFPIDLPALCERSDDIPVLASHFLRKHGFGKLSGFSDGAMAALMAYSWPGNVRELENVVRRAAILAQSEGRTAIQTSDLPEQLISPKQMITPSLDFKPLEMQILDSLRALAFSRAAISQTAQALGNRDRGTITEYFRGICFEQLVAAGFDAAAAAHAIAASNDAAIIARVRTKIDEYLQNLSGAAGPHLDTPIAEDRLAAISKGLPKKYHGFLQQILENFDRIS